MRCRFSATGLAVEIQPLFHKSMFSYLIYMAVWLLEMRRVLKSTGSLWLHCDDTASHYPKGLKGLGTQMTAVGTAQGAIASLWHASLSLSEYDALSMLRHTPCPSRP